MEDALLAGFLFADFDRFMKNENQGKAFQLEKLKQC